MDLLDHVLRRMGRHATTLLPFSLLIGILFQDLAAAARPLVGPLATLLLTLALMRTDWPRVRALLARPGLALAPSAAILIAVPLTMPPLALWLLGFDLRIGAAALSLRLAAIVLIALAGAIAIRAWLKADGVRHNAHKIDGCAVLVLMVFAIPLMDGIVARALAEPVKLTGFIVGSFAGMFLCNAVMALGTLPFTDLRTALTAGYCSNGRNNALLMAVLPATADPDIFLFIAAVQVPIYVIPSLLQPIYRRLLHDPVIPSEARDP